MAVATAIARPLYFDLAPHASITAGDAPTDPGALTLGNPALKPMRSVNEDVLLEHFFSGVGVVQAGVFAKQISNFIYTHSFFMSGGLYDGYNAVQPENAKAGSITGVEAAWQQRLAFLPGALNGLGVEANGTYSQSSTSTNTRASIPIPKMAKWNGNLTGTYTYRGVTARVSDEYNGSYLYTVGDGSDNPSTADKFMLAHAQVDASLNVAAGSRAEVVLQGINLNNEPFGFYYYSQHTIAQREFYGTTAVAMVKLRY